MPGRTRGAAISGTSQVASYDGRFVVFSTAAPLVAIDTYATDDVYLRDTIDGIRMLVSERGGHVGDDSSFEPTTSADGQYVAFTTVATNLSKDENGGALDVVLKDLFADRIRLVSVGTDGGSTSRTACRP